jgi:hypothetical protein
MLRKKCAVGLVRLGEEMSALRWLLVVACLVSVVRLACCVRWEARLETSGSTLVLDLPSAPLWNPPAAPSSQREFLFKWGHGMAVEAVDSTSQITLSPALGRTLVDALYVIWPGTCIVGLLYVLVRGGRRDVMLHMALCIGGGLTLAVAVGLSLWLVYGPGDSMSDEWLGVLGLICGATMGACTLRERAPSRGAR